MTKDEALKMAIKAMTNADKSINEFFEGLVKLGVPKRLLKIDKSTKLVPAINACKKSLEQPEPRLFLDLSGSNGNHPVNPPAQEPVAWIYFHSRMEPNVDVQFEEPEIKKSFDYDVTWKKPLYTHPHQWQELTEDEIAKCFGEVMIVNGTSSEFTPINFARAIEQALKEKNHG